MYHTYYGLNADPFRLSPDHAFCYRYPSFAKGRAYMQYALRTAEGFVVVTGRPGMGKTTLINDLLADYGPSDYLIANLVNTTLEAKELLRSVAYEFGIDVESLDKATILYRLKQLFEQSRRANRPPLLVVDEAQNLGRQALEELRLLTNLQLDGRPLLQIFLVGQEGLRENLADPGLEQLRQRITAAAHLEPLSEEQTAAYVIHRLRIVGWNDFPKIKASVLPIVCRATEGVPRRINQFCSRLLLHGSVEEKAELREADANIVLSELSSERLSVAPDGKDGAAQGSDLSEGERESDAAYSEEEIFAEAEQLLAKQRKIVLPRRPELSSIESRDFADHSRPVAPVPPLSRERFSEEQSQPFVAERRDPSAPTPNPFREHRRNAPVGLVAMVLLLAGIVWATVNYFNEASGFRNWLEDTQRNLFGTGLDERRSDAAGLRVNSKTVEWFVADR